MKDIFHFLLSDPLFNTQVKHITKTYPPNEKILEQGKPHANLYVIKTGKVKVMINNMEKEKTLTFVRPCIIELSQNDIFGEFGIVDDLPSSADVITVTESEITEIDIASLQTFLNAHPEIGYKISLYLLQIVIKRLRHADKAIVSLYTWGLKAHHIDKILTESNH